MKILVVSQYYPPEPFRIGDICEEMAKRGHQVTVLTSVPNYPMGEIYPGYEGNAHRDETVNGVHIRRCFTIPRRQGTLFRFLNYYAYMFSASREAARLKEAFDVVFVNGLSPVLQARPAIRFARRHKIKTVLYCMDLWPVSLKAGGVTEKNPIYRYFAHVSKRLYRGIDLLLISSRAFRGYMTKQFGIDDARIRYLPQHAEKMFDSAVSAPQDKATADFLFAGNIGAAQNVPVILGAARLLRDAPGIRFHIVGDGIKLAECQALAKEWALSNVVFYGRRPASEMPSYYEKADAMLVTLTGDDFSSMTLPGKTQSYLAAGKPVISSANGETAEILTEAKCGYCVPAEDEKALSDAVRKFAALTPAEKKALGENARAYYEANFTAEKFYGALEEVLSRAAEGKKP